MHLGDKAHTQITPFCRLGIVAEPIQETHAQPNSVSKSPGESVLRVPRQALTSCNFLHSNLVCAEKCRKRSGASNHEFDVSERNGGKRFLVSDYGD